MRARSTKQRARTMHSLVARNYDLNQFFQLLLPLPRRPTHKEISGVVEAGYIGTER